MSNKILYPCGICGIEVVTNAIECSSCSSWIHLKCANLKKKNLINLKGNTIWNCSNCTSILPFSSVDNDELLYLCNVNNGHNSTTVYSSSLETKCQEFDSITYNSIRSNDFDVDDVRDLHITNADSNYYTIDQFKSSFHTVSGLSILSLNARSLKKIWLMLNNFCMMFQLILILLQ